MFKIVADSSCDMLEMDGVLFESVPLTISTDEREYIDDATLDCHEMLNYMASYKGRSYTACPSCEGWLKAFEGSDELYVVTITSGLSGTYNSAKMAADMFKETHPDVKILCFDSLSTGPQMRLIIEQIAAWKKEGVAFEEMEQKLIEYRDRSRLFFAFESLHNLAQNGRINKVLAASIGILGIRIVGTASKEGTINTIGKFRGEGKVIESILVAFANAGFKDGKVYICDADNPKLAEKLRKAIATHFPEAKVQTYPARGLCSFYVERGGIIVGCEC